MRLKNLLTCLTVALFLSLTATHNASSSNWGTVQITGIDAPSSVPTGQSLTVGITVEYVMNIMVGSSLYIGFREHGEIGNNYQGTTSSNCLQSTTTTLCVAQVTSMEGSITVTFSLNAPNNVGTWKPAAIAYITVLDLESMTPTTVASVWRSITINVT